MKLQEQIKAKGVLSISVFDQEGKLREEITVDNLVVTTGLNWMASRYVGTPTAMSHMAVGAGVVAPVAANTALGSELGRAALISQTSSGAVSTFSATFAAGVGTGAITEAGIFNAVSAGVMLNRAVFPVVNKGALDTMQINWTVTQTAV